eukprot:scaffold493972_cov50-Prasinocladus_malaysianus.AAC.1
MEAAELYESGEGPLAQLNCEALAEEIFELAASGANSQKNRAALYDLNTRFLKAHKRGAGNQK